MFAAEPLVRPLSSYYLGRRGYGPVHDAMTALVTARQRGEVGDTLLLLEHEPVITLGRGGKPENILASESQLRALGVQVISSGRGGDVTLHAPGQLVAYPIFDLAPHRQDVRRYVNDLTRIMNELVQPFGVQGGTVAGKIGLWVDAAAAASWPGEESALVPRKIGAIGVRISRWVTSHGFALNLTTDLNLFRLIIPCGISSFGVTSLEELSGECLDVRQAAEGAAALFAEHFQQAGGPLRDLSALSDGDLLPTLLG